MTAPARQLQATPIFAGARVCGCGTILSRYNPDERCAVCAHSYPRQERALDLDRLIAGLLLVHSALHEDEPLNVGQQLAAMGVQADSWAVQAAVKHAERRHGLVCRGVRGRPGYEVVEWERRYKTAVGFSGVPMERGEDGRFAGVASLLQRSEGQPQVAPSQEALFEPEEPGLSG